LQVDWVEFPKDNLSAFVATMGYSRASYVEYEKIEMHISELPDSDAGVVPDTFAMRFSRV